MSDNDKSYSRRVSHPSGAGYGSVSRRGMPLPVGRESSLALLDSLEGPEKLLGVVAQLDPRVEIADRRRPAHASGRWPKFTRWCGCPTATWWRFWKVWNASGCWK